MNDEGSSLSSSFVVVLFGDRHLRILIRKPNLAVRTTTTCSTGKNGIAVICSFLSLKCIYFEFETDFVIVVQLNYYSVFEYNPSIDWYCSFDNQKSHLFFPICFVCLFLCRNLITVIALGVSICLRRIQQIKLLFVHLITPTRKITAEWKTIIIRN